MRVAGKPSVAAVYAAPTARRRSSAGAPFPSAAECHVHSTASRAPASAQSDHNARRSGSKRARSAVTAFSRLLPGFERRRDTRPCAPCSRSRSTSQRICRLVNSSRCAARHGLSLRWTEGTAIDYNLAATCQNYANDNYVNWLRRRTPSPFPKYARRHDAHFARASVPADFRCVKCRRHFPFDRLSCRTPFT